MSDNMDFCPPPTVEEILGSEEYKYQCQVASSIWECKNGLEIPIEDMDIKHIKNCLKLIYKSNGIWRHEYLRLFEKELRKRKHENI